MTYALEACRPPYAGPSFLPPAQAPLPVCGCQCSGVRALQGKWSALRDAADAYSELSEFARREKQWLLQRVRLFLLYVTTLSCWQLR